jgi:MHS family citrate/tricarballylate:H+ symporter-like MFS transporter
MLIVMTTVSFYLITVYTPTFGKSVMQLSIVDSLLITLFIGISNLFWLPVMGALSDKIGRWPIMGLFSGLTLLTAYPALSWLVANPSYENMLVVELWLSFLYASYNGATIVALTEIIPIQIRTTGFSLAYSLATALFGGFTPLIATWLIETTGDKASPGYWLAMAGGMGLIATILIYKGMIKARD